MTDNNRPPSLEFEDAFCNAGSIRATCDGCGREFFDGTMGNNFDNGELEELERYHDEDPEKYIRVDHSVGLIHLMGRTYVIGCPCNKLRYFEDFLRDNKRKIGRYFEKRSKIFAEEARDLDKVAVACGVVR